MNVGNLFLSFEGRIGRLQYWIGTVAVMVVTTMLEWMLGVPILDDRPDFRTRLIAFVIGSISVFPIAAIAAKRLHDRNQTARYVWVLVAALAVALVGDLFGYFDQSTPVTFIGWIAIAFVAVIVVIFLVELGFRRGTPGPNQYGPDPHGRRA